MSQNGKGDKPRFYPDEQYRDNYDKIFGEKMNLVDYRGRTLEVGKRVRVEVDIPSAEGMLYKNSIVKLDEFDNKNKKIRVTDSTGKVWWVEPSQVSCSFLQEINMFGDFVKAIDEILEIIWGSDKEEEKPKRARTKKGRYKADDKSTKDVNEAWVGGKAPKKKRKK